MRRRPGRINRYMHLQQVGSGVTATAVIEAISQAIEAGLIARKHPERYSAPRSPRKHTKKRGKKYYTYVFRSSAPKIGW